jgi:uncharacterized membrane protein
MSYVLAAIAIAGAVLVARFYPERVRELLRYVFTVRQVVFGGLVLVGAFFLIGSGSTMLVLVGTLILVLAALYLYYSRVRGEQIETLL